MKRVTILSHFDPVQGPSILASVPALGDDSGLFNAVPKLIDVADKEQFFLSTLQGVYCANYYFKLGDATTRGRYRLLLISLAFEAGPRDDKEAALRFLTGCESLLRSVAKRIKTHAPFKENGLMAPANVKMLKELLHELHDMAFFTSWPAFMGEREKTGRIIVLGPEGTDSKGIIDELLRRITSENKHDLKTRLVLNAASELLFVDFDCIERGAPGCWNENCPGCKGLAAESDAAIIVYDPATLDDKTRGSITDYVKSIEAAREIPVILLAVEEDNTGKTPRKFLDEQFLAMKTGIKGMIKHFTTSLLDATPFKDAMAALVKMLI